MTSPRRARFLKPALVALCLSAMTGLTGCTMLAESTGEPGMQWVGESALSKDAQTVPEYKAVAALPDLTPLTAATGLGHGKTATKPTTKTSADKTTLTGEDWMIAVRQSPFTTSVKYNRVCGTPSTDRLAIIDAGINALEALGGEADGWTWMVFAQDGGIVRALAEPNIENKQTWATGSVSVIADDKGVCAVSASLMAFEKTGKSTPLDSAYDIFQDARHSEGLAIKGKYVSVEQTWTLKGEGLLVPVWHFTNEESRGFVAVDLGDGLETAPDTQTVLQQASGSPVQPE